ncbi:sulfotransferase family 2 domain-containing protein [Falsirhodobacter halotolerans]|uniref:sulfotransferase family 2 domain-containing protein n=1 Tax=Falsirhodobacter halotolerans TaxID=1146892 RepID=UPI001FD02309|nr:sulfotransferase family 2 domain-containing protein [Falsirhodobacter halotolerans]MCJ8138978.1 sulfotransferase family protein [Falsirhodobacter halotolerans]
MPIFKHAGQLLFFAHVPKCAGTSIEDHLVRRFGPAAFLNRRHAPGNKHNWTRTSPQHLPARQLALLFPDGFFDAGFAVVRDPVARVRSAFHYHQTKRGKIPAEETLETWLTRVRGFNDGEHARYDDHFRTQGAFVPEWCTIFHLEDGLDGLSAWLDDWAGPTTVAPIGRALVGTYDSAPVDPDLAAMIREHYADDYARFDRYRPSATT